MEGAGGGGVQRVEPKGTGNNLWPPCHCGLISTATAPFLRNWHRYYTPMRAAPWGIWFGTGGPAGEHKPAAESSSCPHQNLLSQAGRGPSMGQILTLSS